jgi:hypothetical protein
MRLSIFIMGLLVSAIAAAKDGGVAEPNGSIDVSYVDSTHVTVSSFGGVYRMPVGEYGGVAIAAIANRTDGKAPYLDTTGQAAGLQVLLRKFDLGAVAVIYSHGDISADSISASYDTYGFTGVYYSGSIDAMVGYTRAESDTVANSDAKMVAGRLYLDDNLATELSMTRRDSTDGYGVSFTYQPVMFANDIGLTVSYESDDSEDSVGVSIEYYFGTKVSLIDRNRKY